MTNSWELVKKTFRYRSAMFEKPAPTDKSKKKIYPSFAECVELVPCYAFLPKLVSAARKFIVASETLKKSFTAIICVL
jgi:hypothetical protein